MSTIVWEYLMTRVVKESNGTYSVVTPISYERGFTSENDATQYAETYGRIDNR